ncbi:MAG: hypothetical protein JXB88_20420, partial [Spirochaetales bacterium]|nr:hypothetical protein [Spirochaetales bacterium]
TMEKHINRKGWLSKKLTSHSDFLDSPFTLSSLYCGKSKFLDRNLNQTIKCYRGLIHRSGESQKSLKKWLDSRKV